MNVDNVIVAGILAGIFQFFGYVVYYRLVIRNEVRPNPLTWLMLAYGTVILTILEWDNGASVGMLILPITCSLCGFGVAVLIWRKAYKEVRVLKQGIKWYCFWPTEWKFKNDWDGYSFLGDLILTGLYIAAWALSLIGWISPESRMWAALVFLVISNLTTFTSFTPILRQVWSDPKSEKWLPWAIWTIAYMFLFLETLGDIPGESFTWNVQDWSLKFWEWIATMIYPVSNILLHAFIAIWVTRPPKKRWC